MCSRLSYMISGNPFLIHVLILWGKSAASIFFARETTEMVQIWVSTFMAEIYDTYFSKPNILVQVTKAM